MPVAEGNGLLGFLRKLFESDFMPHGFCYYWDPGLVWLHVVSDGLITLAYFSIPAFLLFFVRKRRELEFAWMYLLFALFIFLCGTTHLLEIWTLWNATYRLEGVIKLLTGVVSVATAGLLVPLVPRALAIPTPAQLEASNAQLAAEITERRQAQGDLDRFFTLSLDLLCIADFDGYFRRLNPAWETTLGYTAEELQAQPYLAFVHPDDRDATEAEARRLALGGRVVSFENRYRCKDGVYRRLLWMATPAVKERLIYAIARDVTQSKEAEEEIRKLNQNLQWTVEELEEANRELTAFSYSVSHDLRAPLRHIIGFVHILRTQFARKLPEEAQHYLERVVQAAGKMGALIDDLLALARLGRQEVVRVPTELDSLVREVAEELQAENGERAIDWRIEKLPAIECDPALMRQVFVNLLSNAVKYTRSRESARIEVGQTEQEGRRVIYVCDNGVGFSMDYADKLFGVFQRLHSQAEFEGSGIGLATVQRILRKHGGRIWAEAEPDKGATFYFTVGG